MMDIELQYLDRSKEQITDIDCIYLYVNNKYIMILLDGNDHIIHEVVSYTITKAKGIEIYIKGD